jgi:hypothetical protein
MAQPKATGNIIQTKSKMKKETKPFTAGCSNIATAATVPCGDFPTRPLKVSPLLFSTPMIKALLAGKKTQTRRVIKKGTALNFLNEGFTPEYIADPGNASICPWGTAGDIIWVKETFRPLINCQNGEAAGFAYRADFTTDFEQQFTHKWKPSIFMPFKACRIFLQIKSIKVQRLMEISDDDSIAEGISAIDGVTELNDDNWGKMENINHPVFQNYLKPGYACIWPSESFSTLWQKINGQKSWDENPWVWVIELSLLKIKMAPPIGFEGKPLEWFITFNTGI